MLSSIQRVALVSGANRGIGFAIVEQLARTGLKVIIGARSEKNGLEAQKKLVIKGLDVHFTLLDVSDPISIMAAVGRVNDAFGRLDVLVNNAGIMIDAESDILTLSLGLLHNTLETNAFGPLLLSQGLRSCYDKNQYGRIVNISSTLGSWRKLPIRNRSIPNCSRRPIVCLKPCSTELPSCWPKNCGKRIFWSTPYVRDGFERTWAVRKPRSRRNRLQRLRSGWQPCPMTARPAGFFENTSRFPGSAEGSI